jgi:hypothetical protein
MPVTRPSIATDAGGRTTTVYASWNGATQVARWQVLGGTSATRLSPVTSSRKAAFETTIRLPRRESFVAVQALDAHGHALGTSKAVSAS